MNETLGLLETVRKWLAPACNMWLSDIGIPSANIIGNVIDII